MSPDQAHLSIDQLADLGADALAPAEVAVLQAHLTSCVECRATNDLLAEVPTLLAGAAPVPIPAEVTARVIAAIEREQLARAGAPDQSHAPEAAHPRAGRAGARRGLGARIGAGLLGATAVLGGGYLVLNGVLAGGDDAPTAGQADTAADAGAGGAVLEPEAADELAYGAASLDQDVARLLTQQEVAAPETARSPGETASGEDGGIGTFDTARTDACVAAIQRRAGSPAAPLAVDVGTYDGQPAVVIVLPEESISSSASRVDVWVVGTACVDADGDVADVAADLDVLAHRSVRP